MTDARKPKSGKQAASTGVDQRPPHLFKPGQSGNPKGRPKGSRQKLGESFVSALQADFEAHGPNVIAAVREKKPHEYLKVCASILPKELNLNVNPLEAMTDDELVRRIRDLGAAVESALGGTGGAAGGNGSPDPSKPAGGVSSVH